MQVIIAVICVLGAGAVIIFMSTLPINGIVKFGIVALAVLIAVYGMARIKPKESRSGKDAGK